MPIGRPPPSRASHGFVGHARQPRPRRAHPGRLHGRDRVVGVLIWARRCPPSGSTPTHITGTLCTRYRSRRFWRSCSHVVVHWRWVASFSGKEGRRSRRRRGVRGQTWRDGPGADPNERMGVDACPLTCDTDGSGSSAPWLARKNLDLWTGFSVCMLYALWRRRFTRL